MKEKIIERILEIIPGFLSWSLILFLLIPLSFKPSITILGLIVYLIYWCCRLLYMSTLLLLAHHRILSKKKYNWIELCKKTNQDINFEEIIHVVLYPTYKEPLSVLERSLNALKDTDFPKDKIIVVLAGEEREENVNEKLAFLKEKFRKYFKDFLITVHPKEIKEEIPCKGANATYAAKRVKEYLEKNNYDLKKVIISCFDADTCPDKNYFSCLTYHFLTNPKRYRASFQPLPVYNNNIYQAPAFARTIEMGSTFWQLIESMRYEKFITFSSHSMSFHTLVEVGYWPVNLVSDDSLIFWKCFLKYNGDYRNIPLDVPVYMDIAIGKTLKETLIIQYKQKRRWAQGVENFMFLGKAFLKNKNISFFAKIRKLFQLLDNHINWATWGIIISLISPLVLFWGKIVLKDSLIFLNLSYINRTIFNFLSLIIFICIAVSKEFLPPKPKELPFWIYISFFLQWFLIPVVSAFINSLPALDAQTRLMLGKKLDFYHTPKEYKS